MGKDSDDYEVGYGKPPISGQFKKGQSGNPSGRAKKGPTHKGVLSKLLGHELEAVGLDGKPMTTLEGLYRKQIQAAGGGSNPAMKQLIASAERHGVGIDAAEPELSENDREIALSLLRDYAEFASKKTAKG